MSVHEPLSEGAEEGSRLRTEQVRDDVKVRVAGAVDSNSRGVASCGPRRQSRAVDPPHR